MPSRFIRSRLAGFQCPCCGANLPYKLTRIIISATIEERKDANDYCFACHEEFRVQQPSVMAHKQARLRFASVAVGLILLALAVFALLIRLFPGLPGWLALTIGALIGLAPLPFVEAWATRGMAELRKIKRRKPPLAPPDACTK